jgi:hypothetical protein
MTWRMNELNIKIQNIFVKYLSVGSFSLEYPIVLREIRSLILLRKSLSESYIRVSVYNQKVSN